MSGEVNFSAVNGWFKRRYDKKLRDLRTRDAPLYNLLPFDSANKLGESYQVNVMLVPPNGFTYAGSAGNLTALKQARNQISKQATLTGYELDLKEQIVWKVFSSAVSAGEASFVEATSEIVMAMKVAAMNRIEASLLHGQRGYGTVSSILDNSDGTMNIIFTAATWAPGLWWATNVGSTWDSFTSTTKNNASGALVLQGITASTKTIKVSFTGTASAEVAAGDVIYPEGAYDGTTHFDMPGLLAQAGNTSGTSLGLSASTYPNWAGNTYDANGPAGYYVIEDALSALRDRGAKGRIIAVVSNKLLSLLIVELMSARLIDSSYNPTKQKNGTQSVAYISPAVGEVEIVASPMMKWGEALLLPVNDSMVTCRLGSSDITFNLPGKGDEFFWFDQTYNAAVLAAYSDQAVMCKKPNSALLMTGITYPSAA